MVTPLELEHWLCGSILGRWVVNLLFRSLACVATLRRLDCRHRRVVDFGRVHVRREFARLTASLASTATAVPAFVTAHFAVRKQVQRRSNCSRFPSCTSTSSSFVEVFLLFEKLLFDVVRFTQVSSVLCSLTDSSCKDLSFEFLRSVSTARTFAFVRHATRKVTSHIPTPKT